MAGIQVASKSDGYLHADWPAPAAVRTLVTTRRHAQGHSRGRYADFNLGTNTGEDASSVAANRHLLATGLPNKPIWLQQVHGTVLVNAAQAGQSDQPLPADGCWANQPGLVCAVLTADCLPLLLCDRQGTTVAAVHAGWRGLYAGIIGQAVAQMAVAAEQLMVWLGPAISQRHYQVEAEFRQRFVAQSEANAPAFTQAANGLHADLYELARIQLRALGVPAIYGGNHCSYAEHEDFYSYRRDQQTGRQASMIWLQ